MFARNSPLRLRTYVNIVAQDLTPSAFSFTDQTNVGLATVCTSNEIVVAGLTPGVEITFAASGGTVSRNGGAFAASTLAQNGDSLQVRVTASGSYGTGVSCVLTGGAVSDTFTATTLADPGGGGGGTTNMSSVTKRDITWTFSTARPVGQYANGDYFVVGPVSITAISPASAFIGDRWRHGTQVNPQNGAQGYDSFDVGNNTISYDQALNVAPGKTGTPLVLSTGSVVSTISIDVPNSQGRPTVKSMEVLTVVSTVPPAGSFRPTPYRADKTSYWKESDLNYGILRSLAPVSGTPSLATVTASIARIWNVQSGSFQAENVKAADNGPNYGREISNHIGRCLLSLHLNYSNAQKRDLFVYLVQWGIDIYGTVQNGVNFATQGGGAGYGKGFKMPMTLAALALNDTAMKAAVTASNSSRIFNEDADMFVVSQADVDTPRYTGDGRPRSPFPQGMIGTPEWQNGTAQGNPINRRGANWDSYAYRWVGCNLIYQFLMAHLTIGARALWTNSTGFDYIDRFTAIDIDGVGQAAPNATELFAKNMWLAYRSLGNAPWTGTLWGDIP